MTEALLGGGVNEPVCIPSGERGKIIFTITQLGGMSQYATLGPDLPPSTTGYTWGNKYQYRFNKKILLVSWFEIRSIHSSLYVSSLPSFMLINDQAISPTVSTFHHAQTA